jgi:hypothetical protein
VNQHVPAAGPSCKAAGAVPDDQPGKDVVSRLDEVTSNLADLAEVLGGEEELGRVLQHSVD